MDRQTLARHLRELRSSEPPEFAMALRQALDAATSMFGVDGALLILQDDDGCARWMTGTDATAHLLDQVQRDFGEGPCLDAYRDGRVVAVDDLAASPRFARLGAVVGQMSVRTMLSVPLMVDGQPIGSLTLYASRPQAWSPKSVEAVAAFCAVVVVLVVAQLAWAGREREAAQLRCALAQRVVIEQAKGVLAARDGVAPDVAFARLRAQARSRRRRLVDLAQEVVARVGDVEPDEDVDVGEFGVWLVEPSAGPKDGFTVTPL